MEDLKTTIALVSAEEAKYFLESQTDEDDEMIDFFINSISEFFANFTGVEFLNAVSTDRYFDGPGSSWLILPCYNLTVVSAITLNDSTLTEGPSGDFCRYERDGILKINSGVWTKGHQNIKTTFTGGWTLASLPADLKHAALKLIGIEYKHYKKSDWGETTRSFPEGSITQYSEESLDPFVKEILIKYKKEFI